MSMLVNGRTGAGKSTLIFNIIKQYLKKHKKLLAFIFTDFENSPALRNLKDHKRVLVLPTDIFV